MNNVYARAAADIAREAGQFLKHFSDTHKLNVENKGSVYDFVTNADQESQALIARRLKERFPDHRFVGEEDGIPDAELERMFAEAGPEECFWVADPLDGTINYIHHLPGYAVSIGLVRGGESVAGAIYLPESDQMFTAARGEGAWLNGQPIRASECAELRLALTASGMPVTSLEKRRRFMRWVDSVGMRTSHLRLMGCACENIALTACGRAEAYWEIGPHPWDVAAGLVICREAGCVVTDMFGGPFRFGMENGVLMSAPGIHDALSAALREAE